MFDETPQDFVAGELTHAFASVARGLSHTTLVSFPLPETALCHLAAPELSALLRRATVAWRPAGQATMLAGFGREVFVQGDRDSTLEDAAAVLRDVLTMPRIDTVEGLTRPAFFGGARFAAGGSRHDPAWDPFGGWGFTLPRMLLAVTDGRVEGSVTLRLEPGESEDHIAERLAATLEEWRGVEGSIAGPADTTKHEWCDMVSTAIGEIAGERYKKVVLARTLGIQTGVPIDEGEVLARLAQRYGGCYVFKVASAGGSWVGATPELLCRVNDGAVSTIALAGSVPRGSDPESDDALGARLMGDAKERHEHALVVHALREALAPFCDELSIPEEPQLMRVANIQHLRTPIEGRLRFHPNVLSVVAALHPSPAVGGWPRLEALEAIERLEGIDRGWYAGPIGRIGLDGDGEFAVGLRSALIRGEVAQLYAGAGIVHGSDPAREYAETETKFRPLREAIDGL